MLKIFQHDDGGEFNVTLSQVLNLFQGLMKTDTFIFDYGLWSYNVNFLIDKRF